MNKMLRLLTDTCERLCWICDRQTRARWLFEPVLQRFLLRLEARLERKHEASLGITTYGSIGKGPENSLGQDSAKYSPLNYFLLRAILDHLNLASDDVFVDLGCGKGRAVMVAAQRGCRKAIGVELSDELVEAARANTDALGLSDKAEIVKADAALWDPSEGTVFFLFNPFGAATLQRFLANLRASVQTNPRRIRIAYICCPHAKLLEDADWLEEDMTVKHRQVFRVWAHTYAPEAKAPN